MKLLSERDALVAVVDDVLVIESTDTLPVTERTDTRSRADRKPVPDEFYLAQLREIVAVEDGVIPSAREVARRPSVGQDRARRLVVLVTAQQQHAE
jgi:hypothetical protein